MSETNPFRLPRTVAPEAYQLELAPDLDAGRFEGTARIQLAVLTPTIELLLNAADLQIHELHMEAPDGAIVSGDFTLDPKHERLRVTLAAPAAPGRWQLVVRFSGAFASRLRGFYRVVGRTRDGDPAPMAVTQCFPTDARRVFPCWDEPDFKARFRVSVVAASSLTALSNGPEVSRDRLADGRRRTTFAETVPMSTYLLAVVVGAIDLTAPKTADSGTVVRIATPPGRTQLAEVAEEAALSSLSFFTDYFDMPCPAPKMDHAAVPDFAAGAMENLGLVTYREEALLVEAARASSAERRRITSTVAHETSHMWFGDLVTMRWWNGSWLNEAFATLMANLAVDAIHGDWDVWTPFAASRSHALAVDALAATRPIDYPVEDPAEAWGMFDVLTYVKGAAVLRMLEQYLGPVRFRAGIRTYLNRHRLSNAETADLWTALEEASGEPVAAVANSWVTQGGFPLVSAAMGPDGASLLLAQSRFRWDGQADDATWHVPVTVGVHLRDGTTRIERCLLGAEPKVLPLPPDVRFIVANEGAWGFFRVMYDRQLFERLVGAFSELCPRERVTVVEDTWAAVQAGRVPVSHVLQLWRELGAERNPEVWRAAIGGMSLLCRTGPSSARGPLRERLGKVVLPLLTELGMTPTDHDSEDAARLRAILVRVAGSLLENHQVQRQARELLERVRAGAAMSTELLGALIDVTAAAGGPAEWEEFHAAIAAAPTPQDAARYRQALAEFSEPALVERTLAYFASPTLSIQHRADGLARCLGRPHAAKLAWGYLEAHWDEVLEAFPTSAVGHLLSPVATMVEAPLCNRVQDWLAAHPVPPAAERQVRQALEMQATNRRLADRVAGELRAALDP